LRLDTLEGDEGAKNTIKSRGPAMIYTSAILAPADCSVGSILVTLDFHNEKRKNKS
jgi:hypothetical protein